jgi:hypothetical protein
MWWCSGGTRTHRMFLFSLFGRFGGGQYCLSVLGDGDGGWVVIDDYISLEHQRMYVIRGNNHIIIIIS